MGDFLRCIPFILKEEGGYVNHPQDPGGETHFGISKRAYPELDIKHLTKNDAIRIYHRDYWTPIKGDQFPPGLDLILLDAAVNQGVITAIHLLQKTLKIHVDGEPGTITQSRAAEAMPNLIVTYAAQRIHRYKGSRKSDVFGMGWYSRILKIHHEATLMAES